MLGVNVKGGTGAGRKRPLKFRRREPWKCGCGVDRPAYLTCCSQCGKDRP